MKRKHQLAKCEECPLNASKYVPSDGPQDAEIIVVGEAPGSKEVKEGKPFVGPSGQLLNAVLREHKIKRDRVFTTNVVACRPKGNADPPQEAVDACSGRLNHEIESNAAKHIIATGRFAAASVLGDPKLKITQARIGNPKQSNRFPGKYVIPTWHPAYALRVPNVFPQLLGDFEKVKARTTRWHPPVVKIFESELQACLALEQILNQYDRVALDLEVGVDKDEATEHPDKLLSAGLSYAPGKAVVLGEDTLRSPKVRGLLARLVEDKTVILQNGKFDLQVLAKMGIVNGSLKFDTMLAHYALEGPGQGTNGLDYMGQELLGAPSWKHVTKGYKDFSSIPKDVLYPYNAWDAAVTYDLADLLEQRLVKDGTTKLHDFLCKASDFLMHCELRGVALDEEYAHELDKKLTERMETQRIATADWVQNPNSPQQVKAALESLGVFTPSTDKNHLADILYVCEHGRKPKDSPRKIVFKDAVPEQIVPFITRLKEFKKLSKQRGTYVRGLLKRARDGRITSTYGLHTTTTGRTSSRDPNLQNVPRYDPNSGLPNMRKMIVPAPGNVFVQCDYAGAELRVVAQLCGDEGMLEILQDPDRDFMSEVAARIYGPGFTKEQRVKAKTVVHGVNYGRTAHGIASDPEIDMSINEAQKILDSYKEQFPKLFEWHKQIHDIIFDSEDYLINPWGRRHRVYLITTQTREDIYKEGLAFLPQSIASDICISAGIELDKQGYPILIPVHDSLLAEVPEEDKEYTARHMMKVMEEAAYEVFDQRVPFKVEAEWGRSWGELEALEV